MKNNTTQKRNVDIVAEIIGGHNKQYHVESGEEKWDYDSQVPTREVTSYWVMLGKEKIKSFSYYQQAIDYKNKLNNAINSVKV